MKMITRVAVVALAALFCVAVAEAADVDFNLSWSAPTTGGPVDSYAVECLDASGAVVLQTQTAGLSAAGSAADVSEGAGSCSLTAIGPGGTSAPVVAAFSISVTPPPGAPGNFTITLSCTVIDGAAICEQV